MKQFITYCFLLHFALPAYSQYYLRGEVKDEKGNALSGTKIFVHNAKSIYNTGPSGSFGINATNLYDSLTLSLDGYDTKVIKVKTDVWQTIVLNIAASYVTKNKPKLISVTKDLKQATTFSAAINNETYFQLVENDFVKTLAYPNTGFSLNINKASYSNIRRFINTNSEVPPDAVRVEEMINYFNLMYKEPQPGRTFNFESQLTSCPWSAESQLLFINVSAKKIDLEKVAPSNFVFLIDVSGSMDMPNRLPLLKAAFQLFVKNLRPIDKVSIVMYGGTVGIWLQPTSGADKEKISKSIEELTAAGDTPGESAIRAAYKLAESTFIKGGNNRIILATDGDFNVGETSEKALDELITKERQTGIYLTCLGVGMGNFKDSKLQTLAKKGNGNYAYLDDIREAEKVLVKELTQTLYAVANDVSMNVNFNPEVVKEYRLIGFDNKKEAIANAENDLEGGEIGSGSSTLAVFQLIPAAAGLQRDATKNIGTIITNYTLPNEATTHIDAADIKNNYHPLDNISKAYKFAAAVAMFGLKIKLSPYAENIDWALIKATALSSAEETDFMQEEFLMQVYKAQKIYDPKKKKKKSSD